MATQNTSRFYQLGAVALFEYRFNNEYSTQGSEEYAMRRISDFSPYVFSLVDGERMYMDTMQPDDFLTGNTALNSSIPFDMKDNVKFHINEADVTYEEYESANLSFGGRRGIMFNNNTDEIAFDTVRVYYVNGYDFNNVDGVYMNISVNGDDARKVTLCRMYLRKERIYSTFKYLDKPMFISNRIYDKYIELKVPSVKYLCAPEFKEHYSFVRYMNVSEATPLKVEYGEVLPENVEDYNKVDKNTFNVVDAVAGKPSISYDSVLFMTTNAYTCGLPQYANSDNITAHIELDKKDGYLKFCGQWMGSPLHSELVNLFNTRIVLYDIGKANRNINVYDASDELTKRQWVGYHEIIARYYYDDDDTIDRLSSSEVHEQVYTYTQSFLKDEFIDDAEKMLLCKPILPKSKNNYPLNNIVFEYNFRLINLLDDVQFLRSASLSVTGDEVNKYFVGAKTLDMSGVINYNVFNKIESVEQKITTPVSNPVGTQYVKVFYNTSDVVLDENGDYIGSDAYVLNLSNSSKNYKFKFRKYDSDGNLVIYDLSDYSLVLYSRDSDGKDIIINPTYSDNMNLVMGEVEFNVPVNDILKLKNVETSKRFMSILVINNDNTKYTLFDFTYN